MSADTFSSEIYKAINDYRMFDGAKIVIVALSGGADSMSLLYFLVDNAQKLNIVVQAAHLNHNIRGGEAIRDYDFVKSYCQNLGIKLYYKSVDIPALSEKLKIGHEECGRRERYRFFDEISTENTVIATAHTASDNAETVILNMVRGCGLDGLCGIPPKRGSVVRPLIFCSRQDVEEYCEINGVPYVTDSTNLGDEYNRNKIRHLVINELKKINPSAEKAINRMSAICRNDAEIISACADDCIRNCTDNSGISVNKLKQYNDSVLSHAVKKLLNDRFGIIPEKKHTDIIINIINSGSGAVEVRKNKIVKIKDGILIFEEKSETSFTKPITEMPFEKNLKIKINGKILEISEKKHKINKKLLINCLSCGIISCDTKIRTRQSGDIFSPYGRNCTKSVKKLFIEKKIPQSERDKILLIANGNNVLWIEGIGVSRQAAVSDEDECFYQIRTEREEND